MHLRSSHTKGCSFPRRPAARGALRRLVHAICAAGTILSIACAYDASAADGPLTNPDPTKPPPYLDLPANPTPKGPSDPASAGVDPAKRSWIGGEYTKWWRRGGREFHPDLTYLWGKPVLLLVISSNEQPAALGRRLNSIVSSCEFLLADTAFDSATVCVATIDAADKTKVSTKNTQVQRAAFRSAVQSAGKSGNLGTAMAAAHANANAIRQICRDLDIQ